MKRLFEKNIIVEILKINKVKEKWKRKTRKFLVLWGLPAFAGRAFRGYAVAPLLRNTARPYNP